MAVKKYRRKPKIIEALQFMGDNQSEIEEWIGCDAIIFKNGRVAIYTLHGREFVNPGDYIIKRSNGEFYPCDPQTFKQKYREIKSIKNDNGKENN